MCEPFYCSRSFPGKLMNCLALHTSNASIGQGKYFRKSFSECAVAKILTGCFSLANFYYLIMGLYFESQRIQNHRDLTLNCGIEIYNSAL